MTSAAPQGSTAQPAPLNRWRALLECMVDRNVSRLLLIVGARSATDVALFLATSVVAYDLGGPAAVGLVGAVRVLPSMVTAGSAALVADRVRRPLVIAGVNACFVLVALLLACVVLLDLGLVALVVVQAVGSVVSGLIKPSMQALLPQLVGEPRRLLPANSAWGLIDAIGGVAGPAGATALLFAAGPEGVFIALAVVYAVTAWLAVSIRSPFQPPTHAAYRRSFWRDSVGGVSLFMRRGGRAHFAVFLTQRLLSGLVTAFVILYAHDVASDGDSTSGTLLAALGVGAFVGSAAAMVTHGHGRVWFVVGSVLTSLPLALVGLTSQIPLAAALLVVSGAGAALAGTHGATLLNRWLPDHVAGRAWGALFGVGAATAALGSIAAPALSDWLGTHDAMVPVGLAAALVPVLCAPGLRFLESSATPSPEALAVVSRTEVLGSLPKVCLERLAAAAVRRAVAPGEVVVRQGDTGDEFYMVESGELQVSQDDLEVRRLGVGDSFGEVALLHSIPRTATVVALTSGSLLALDHEIFVATVTGHAPTEDWADGAVAGLLAEDERRTAT
ncbi:MFS transporter [Nocardioides agariphilus]|uniref:MFS transporter n=1 Tax=Nocardioides agariphilus TaxID=433664 RepID=A0A930VF29_9ACTN|nr:MFS transporter [Nocardioides agariphilus]